MKTMSAYTKRFLDLTHAFGAPEADYDKVLDVRELISDGLRPEHLLELDKKFNEMFKDETSREVKSK